MPPPCFAEKATLLQRYLCDFTLACESNWLSPHTTILDFNFLHSWPELHLKATIGAAGKDGGVIKILLTEL